LVLFLLLTEPVYWFEFILQSNLDTFKIVLPYVPLGILTLAVGLATYFNSDRLGLVGIHLFLVYGYATLPDFVEGLWAGPYTNSMRLFPLLIPLTVLGIHFSGETGLLSSTGLIKTSLLLLELIFLIIFFQMFSEEILGALQEFPQIRILEDVTRKGGINLPYVGFAVSLACYLVMYYFSGRNYYSNYLSLIFWVVFTAVLAFESGTSWVARDFPMHYSLFFTGAGLLLNAKVLNLAWGKAYRDQLTQIPGRMALDEYLVRMSGVYSISMIDIDKFKDFNDTYGHDAGDKVLKQVARIIQKNTSGRAYRFGGEEFTVIYSGRSAEEVEDELESLRQAVADNKVKVTRKSNRATKLLEKKVTISLGLADSEGKETSPEKVLNAADNALYEAKEEGRNQLVLK
jgi:diguanylate cyclase (GGDEF)-like protein